jgi:transcriptional regulator with XRE-family HTH domain
MKHSTSSMGRPTSRIDGARLKALRKESNLSRLALAEKVYERAKRSTSQEVMKNSAGRWETKGTVALGMVEHLAAALGTTVAVLQGAAPAPAPSQIDALEKRLHALLAQGPSPALAKALAHVQEEETPTRELARRIASRLEAAQLSQDQEEFKQLASLGLSTKELTQPTGYEGFWMFIGTGAPGPERLEILRGVSDVIYAVTTEIEQFLAPLHESDAHVAFSQEAHWFHIVLHHARVSRWTRTLRFVRCQPNERGLQWSSPTWLDKYFLDQMPRNIYQHANFVTGFNGIRIPADCTQLRFAITQNPGAEESEKLGMDATRQVVALTAGDLAELAAETLASFKQEGSAHDLVVNWLTANLWETLQPWLADWPLECWNFRQAEARIDVLLDVPANSTVPPRCGHRLSVLLVEQSADGNVQPTPWRNQSVARVMEMLEKSRQAALSAQAPSPPLPPSA